MDAESIIEATASMAVFALLGFLMAVVLWIALKPGKPAYDVVAEAEQVLEQYQRAINEKSMKE